MPSARFITHLVGDLYQMRESQQATLTKLGAANITLSGMCRWRECIFKNALISTVRLYARHEYTHLRNVSPGLHLQPDSDRYEHETCL